MLRIAPGVTLTSAALTLFFIFLHVDFQTRIILFSSYMRISIVATIGIFSILPLQALASKIPLVPKKNTGYGMWISMGSTNSEHFMNPDFSGTVTRFFANSAGESLLPYFPNIPSSETRVVSGRRNHVTTRDTIRVGTVEFPSCPIEFTGRSVSPEEAMHSQDCEGRLALGPRSHIASSHLIAISTCMVSFGDGRTFGEPSIELLNDVPRLESGDTQYSVPILDRQDGWFVIGRLSIDGSDASGKMIDLAIDPSIEGIYLPYLAMKRIAIVAKLKYPDAFVDQLGRLRLPCDAEGRFTVSPRVAFDFSAGQAIEFRYLGEGSFGGPVPNPETGKLGCGTVFRLDVSAHRDAASGSAPSLNHWKVNPLLINQALTVFLDKRRQQITFRTPGSHVRLFIVQEAPRVPVIPTFNRFELITTADGKKELRFPIQNGEEPTQFVVNSRNPVALSDGSFMFTFPISTRGATGETRTPSVVCIIDTPVEIGAPADLMWSFDHTTGLSLKFTPAVGPLRRSSAPRYTVWLHTHEYLMWVEIRPVFASSSVDQDLEILTEITDKMTIKFGRERK